MVELDEIGKEEFATLTCNNVGKPLAFIINNTLYSALIVNESIPNGQFEISGLKSIPELEKLKRLIEVVKLKQQN